MNWIPLQDMATLPHIQNSSFEKPQLIFKHSTRCSISSTVKNRLDRVNTNEIIDCYFLDLLAHRDISNSIAENYQVHHESPQILLIKNGNCIFEENQMAIQWEDIEEQVL